jgi:hypothetical protein
VRKGYLDTRAKNESANEDRGLHARSRRSVNRIARDPGIPNVAVRGALCHIPYKLTWGGDINGELKLQDGSCDRPLDEY